MPKKFAPAPRDAESLEALLRSRSQMAVLCVLVERMNAALQTADLDEGTELGIDIGPSAVLLANAVRTDIWSINVNGGGR